MAITVRDDSHFSLVLDARPNPTGLPDAIDRRELPFDRMAEIDDVLATAHGYWRAKHGPLGLPARGDIDILEIVSLIKHIHIIDVADRDPINWHLRIVGAIVPKSLGWAIGRERISECPWPTLRQALLEDFETVKAAAAPRYQEVAFRADNRVYQYARVLLPLAADGRRVDALMSCVAYRPTPELSV